MAAGWSTKPATQSQSPTLNHALPVDGSPVNFAASRPLQPQEGGVYHNTFNDCVSTVGAAAVIGETGDKSRAKAVPITSPITHDLDLQRPAVVPAAADHGNGGKVDDTVQMPVAPVASGAPVDVNRVSAALILPSAPAAAVHCVAPADRTMTGGTVDSKASGKVKVARAFTESSYRSEMWKHKGGCIFPVLDDCGRLVGVQCTARGCTQTYKWDSDAGTSNILNHYRMHKLAGDIAQPASDRVMLAPPEKRWHELRVCRVRSECHFTMTTKLAP